MILTIPLQGAKLDRWPQGNLTQGFAENPELYKQIGLAGHNGLDIALPFRTPVLAATDGIIFEVEESVGGYGKHIKELSFQQDDGYHYETIYGHLDEIIVVAKQEVKAGQIIGYEGNTGFVISAGLEGLGYTKKFWGNAPAGKGVHLHLTFRPWKKGLVPGLQTKILDEWYSCENYNNGYFGAIDSLPYFNQTNQNKMQYIIDQNQDQWLVDSVLKFAISIADERELELLKSKGIIGGEPIVMNLDGFTFYRGGTEERLKEFFNLK